MSLEEKKHCSVGFHVKTKSIEACKHSAVRLDDIELIKHVFILVLTASQETIC